MWQCALVIRDCERHCTESYVESTPFSVKHSTIQELWHVICRVFLDYWSSFSQMMLIYLYAEKTRHDVMFLWYNCAAEKTILATAATSDGQGLVTSAVVNYKDCHSRCLHFSHSSCNSVVDFIKTSIFVINYNSKCEIWESLALKQLKPHVWRKPSTVHSSKTWSVKQPTEWQYVLQSWPEVWTCEGCYFVWNWEWSWE